jgi:hypothetical protein
MLASLAAGGVVFRCTSIIKTPVGSNHDADSFMTAGQPPLFIPQQPAVLSKLTRDEITTDTFHFQNKSHVQYKRRLNSS